MAGIIGHRGLLLYVPAGGGGSDPNVANRVLQMHMDASPFVDYHGHTFGAYFGSPFLETTIKKYGAGSLGLSNASLGTGHATNLDWTTGDWTLRFFVYRVSGGSNAILATKATGFGSYPFQIIWNSANKLQFLLINSSGSLITNITGATSVSLGAQHHIEISRSGNTFRVFLNGNLEITDTQSAALYTSASDPFVLGASSSGGAPLLGYIDDLSAYKGVALHTANFTPPTAANPD
jgi:hypothetical protein